VLPTWSGGSRTPRPYAPALLIADASFFPNDHSVEVDRATDSTQKVSLMADFGTIVIFIGIYSVSDDTRADLRVDVAS
jgi:hypothetical protein